MRQPDPTITSKAVAIDVRNLKTGMYVCGLDRPWIETPFLFQGFRIAGPRHDFSVIDLQMSVRSGYTDEILHIDKGLEPGSFDIDPAEYFLG